jgi:hypothetical protein
VDAPAEAPRPVDLDPREEEDRTLKAGVPSDLLLSGSTLPPVVPELARLLGDSATRERELREAHRLLTEMGAPIRAEQVARELGSSVESPSEISSTSRT